ELAVALETKAYWTTPEHWMAMRLMGKGSAMPHAGDSEVAAFRTLVVAASPDMDPTELDGILGIETANLDPEARQAQLDAKLPSREDAHEGLWATLNAEFERLMPIREKLCSEDRPALRERIDAEAFDHSKEGVLRRRYKSANHSDMHRCLRQFAEQRRQTEARAVDPYEIEEREAEEQKAEFLKSIEKFEAEKLQKERLRNEPKSSVPTTRRIHTYDRSPDGAPSDFSDFAEYIKTLKATEEAAAQSTPPANPAAPGAGEAQKPACRARSGGFRGTFVMTCDRGARELFGVRWLATAFSSAEL